MIRPLVIGRARIPQSLGFFNWFKTVLLAALTLALTTSLSFAQAAQTGTITGRVFNASRGTYLNNARVTLDGTDRTVFTNEYGEYVLTDVPAGEAKVRAFYSGFEPTVTTVTVTAGQTVTQDLRFGSAETDSDLVKLETFTVAAGRETDTASIAVNEQRFAANIKTVVETSAFGDIAEGNAGEFLKYLPGVTVDYVAADVRTVSVRGFGSAFTSVYLDGFRMASAASGSSIRAFEFEQVSINNAARVEVIKSPTPDFPVDALGGSVNLISKNAFEREGSAFNYRLYLNANSEDVNAVKKSSGPRNQDSFKVLPGADFDYTIPVSKNLGFVITGLTSNQFNEQHRTQNQWNFAQGSGATQGSATPGAPYMQQYQMQDGPKNSFRDSLSFKADWKIGPGQSLWAMYQVNYYSSFFGNRNLTWDVGTAGTSNPAGGAALSYGPDFTTGAAGRGSVRHGTSFRDKYGLANAGAVKYRFKNHDWEIDAGLGDSSSRSWYRDSGNGHFQEVRTTLQGVSKVTYTGVEAPRPQGINALAADGSSIDPYNLSNYRINTARIQPVDAKDKFLTAHLNVRRELPFLPFAAALKVGGETRQQDRDIRRTDKTWTFVGADGVANTADDNAGPYLDTNYGAYPYWGFPHVSWPDPYALWSEFQAHPNYFSLTTAQALAAERFRIQNSQKLKETVNSAYVMTDAHFLRNRLNLIAGVRLEQTDDKGDGALTPTIGGTLADVQANWKERGLHVSKSYDGYYPSVHATYNLTENLLLRASYARTLGRPDFAQILPLVQVNNTDTDTDNGLGVLPARTIKFNNTALRPYQANNYDVSLEYYFRNGGVISIGGFYKDVKDFFGTFNRVATAQDIADLDLSPDYIGYQVTTTINTQGTATIQGGEFNLRQPLTMIPGWGRYFVFLFNATKLHLEGPNSADFSGFIKNSANAGISFEKKPIAVRLNVNYRGRQINSYQTAAAYQVGNTTPVGGTFEEDYAPRFNVDANVEYKFSKRLGFFTNVRNLFNQYQQLERYNSATPNYAKMYRREKFGAQLTVGVKGTF